VILGHPSGLVRTRHYGILGNNRRKCAIEAARAIFKGRGRAVELQSQSVADKPMCCPLRGKAGIRLVAFTDAAGVLHMIGAGPMPCDCSLKLSEHAQHHALDSCIPAKPSLDTLGLRCCLRVACETRLGPSG